MAPSVKPKAHKKKSPIIKLCNFITYYNNTCTKNPQANKLYVLFENKSYKCDNIKKCIPIISLHHKNSIKDSVLKNKLVISSIHKVKGLERKVVIFMGFDHSYNEYYNKNYDFTKCANELYVAVTRATEKMTLIHSPKQNPLQCLLPDDIDKYCLYVNKKNSQQLKKHIILEEELKKMLERKYPPREPKELVRSVTELINQLLPEDIHKACQYFKTTIITPAKSPPIQLISTVKQEYNNIQIEESVAGINGHMIPLFYEYLLHNTVQCFKDLKIKVPKQNPEIIYQQKFINTFLRYVVKYIAYRDQLMYIDDQIKYTNWISADILKKCIQRLSLHISEKAKFEENAQINIVINDNPFISKLILGGSIDCLDQNNIWEFKCVHSLQNEHLLQLAIYMYMCYKSEYKYYVYNILTDEKIQITAQFDDLQAMMQYIIDNLENYAKISTDDQFINKMKNIVIHNSSIKSDDLSHNNINYNNSNSKEITPPITCMSDYFK